MRPRPSTAAQFIWEVPSLRRLILDQLRYTQLAELMTLSRRSLPEVAKVLYRRLRYESYCHVMASNVPHSRLVTYLESVRVLDIRGCLPLLRGLHGFEHLLDLFPLAVVAVAYRHHFSLQTSPMLGRTAAPHEPTLLVQVALTPDNIGQILSPTPIFQYSRSMTIRTIYEIMLGESVQIDWALKQWDHLRLSRFGSSGGIATYQTVGSRSLFKGRPIGLILGREIVHLCITITVDLELLSSHLRRRLHLNLPNIPSMDLVVSDLEGLPTFIAQNRYTKKLCLKPPTGHAFDLIDFLELDWTPLSSMTRESIHLQTLSICISIKEHRSPTHMRSALRSLEWSRSGYGLLALSRLKWRFGGPLPATGAYQNLPPLSLVAKAIVAFCGVGCKVGRNRLQWEDVVSRRRLSARDGMLQRSLVEEWSRLWKELQLVGVEPLGTDDMLDDLHRIGRM